MPLRVACSFASVRTFSAARRTCRRALDFVNSTSLTAPRSVLERRALILVDADQQRPLDRLLRASDALTDDERERGRGEERRAQTPREAGTKLPGCTGVHAHAFRRSAANFCIDDLMRASRGGGEPQAGDACAGSATERTPRTGHVGSPATSTVVRDCSITKEYLLNCQFRRFFEVTDELIVLPALLVSAR
jgi:hypothetical protein